MTNRLPSYQYKLLLAAPEGPVSDQCGGAGVVLAGLVTVRLLACRNGVGHGVALARRRFEHEPLGALATWNIK